METYQQALDNLSAGKIVWNTDGSGIWVDTTAYLKEVSGQLYHFSQTSLNGTLYVMTTADQNSSKWEHTDHPPRTS